MLHGDITDLLDADCVQDGDKMNYKVGRGDRLQIGCFPNFAGFLPLNSRKVDLLEYRVLESRGRSERER